ncbi:hypothetical protein BVY04_00065 [bacterium M21]|nr:hypothetical protein BVY04_00065 [bacterium M21]
MAMSWVLAAQLAGIHLTIAAPEMYQPDADFVASIEGTGSVTVTADAAEAARDADIVYTDVWVSMGFEDHGDAFAVERFVCRVVAIGFQFVGEVKDFDEFVFCNILK